MSQLKINFDTSALVLPGKVMEVMDRASFMDLKVLLCLCADGELRGAYGSESFLPRLIEAVDGDPEGVQAALAFWRGAGLLSIKGSGKSSGKTPSVPKAAPTPTEPASEASPTPAAPTPEAPVVKLRAKAELPHYTTEQLAALLSAHADTANWLDECQRIFGKIFNTLEVNTFLGFVDYLGLDWEYVMLLLTYYVGTRESKGMNKSVRSVEKMAFDLYDRGIHTVDALQEEIRRIEHFSETEGKLRALFGMGDRGMTPTEKKYFSTWLYEYGYGMDIIRLAYEITVDTTGKANTKYMNSVLANWHKENLRTPEAIPAAAEARRASGAGKTAGTRPQKAEPTAGSFDVDDFFAAAVRRSLGDDTPPEFREKVKKQE